jgi:hypothetical protein
MDCPTFDCCDKLDAKVTDDRIVVNFDIKAFMATGNKK